MSDHLANAQRAVKETASIPNFAYRGDLPIGETYAFTISRCRDSGLLTLSNWDTITGDMSTRFPDDCEIVGATHWAVGWVDHFAVRMLDDEGDVTAAGIAILEWQGAIEQYPVASDEDYSRREYEATIESIDDTIRTLGRHDEIDLDNLPAPAADGAFGHGPIDTVADLAGAVFSWLWDHNQSAVENRDDQGGAPDEDDVRDALRALGYTLTVEE